MQTNPLSTPLFKSTGFEESGPTVGKVKKCPVDTFLARGRIHRHPDASGKDVDGCLFFGISSLDVSSFSLGW